MDGSCTGQNRTEEDDCERFWAFKARYNQLVSNLSKYDEKKGPNLWNFGRKIYNVNFITNVPKDNLQKIL